MSNRKEGKVKGYWIKAYCIRTRFQ